VILSSGFAMIRIWEASSGKELRMLEGHEKIVYSVALGRLGDREVIVSGSEDKTVRIWEASTGKELQALKGHEGSVLSVALGQIGGRNVIVSGGDDGTIRAWEFQADDHWTIFLEAPVTSVALNGTYIAASTTAGIAVLAMTWKPE
jgi:WD40 repeat protein